MNTFEIYAATKDSPKWTFWVKEILNLYVFWCKTTNFNLIPVQKWDFLVILQF